jgi:hypothetical protein
MQVQCYGTLDDFAFPFKKVFVLQMKYIPSEAGTADSAAACSG